MEAGNFKYAIYGLTICLLIFAVAGVNTSEASTSTAKQTVTITIPPMRALYVDGKDRITAIFSNTASIAEGRLQVFRGGSETVINERILSEYRKLESKVNWNKVGWVYWRSGSESKESDKKSERAKSS